jgi:hypothetical protein
MQDMNEYILKITETEAKAICHGFGKCRGKSKITEELCSTLYNMLYDNNKLTYYKEVMLKSGVFYLMYEGDKI